MCNDGARLVTHCASVFIISLDFVAFFIESFYQLLLHFSHCPNSTMTKMDIIHLPLTETIFSMNKISPCVI